MAIILGLDPGSRFTGFGLIRTKGEQIEHIQHGVIHIPESLRFPQKLSLLMQKLDELYLQTKPTDTVIEKIFLGKNADSVFKLGHARGVCLALAAKHGSQVAEYAARSVKKVVTGTGAASKDHVRLVVLSLLKLKTDALLDATDALSLAICRSRMYENEELLNRMEQMNP